MTAKNHDRTADTIIDNENNQIFVHAGNALLWCPRIGNEYTLLHGRQGKAIWLTAEELADIAQAIDAMTKAQDGEL